MGLVSLPNSLTDGTVARGSEVRANDDAIVAEVNGGLTDVNIATGAAISGSKISNVAGSRVPGDRIEDDAVDSTKLKDDAAVDANRAVTANHIRNDAVIARCIKTTSFGWTPGGNLLAAASASQDTGLLASTIDPIAVRKVFAGVPATPQMALILSLWLDNNTGKYHLCLYNPTGAGVSLVGMTFSLLYVPAS